MDNKTRALAKKLDKLTGILLLSKHGHPYLLKGYTLQEKKVKHGWFNPTEETVEYIAEIEDSNTQIHFFDHDEFTGLLIRVNQYVEDRNRYVHMLKELSMMGYTIRRKSE